MDDGSPAWPPRDPRPPEVLDRAHWEMLRGPAGHPLVSDFMVLFARDEPARLARMPGLAAARDTRELAWCAHTIAGSCAMLGAREMQACALAVERAVASGRWDEVTPRLTALNQAWSRLRVVLEAEGFRFT
ncbi:MAG TPA: Hpt domain-containing protein [Opitutaceae bacterium]|jgi:HPt (histidine-containing phosphotransfer) domain-containing protein|nr:Hpt domain-containing protein [Opitutaceae bacterium]